MLKRLERFLDLDARVVTGERLGDVLADVRRGIWRDAEPAPLPPQIVHDPTFHEIASRWFEARLGETPVTQRARAPSTSLATCAR